MRRSLFYLTMARRDTFRLRGPLAATTMIVLGICLPLVLLLGLTNGLIRHQEETMLRSPTACMVKVWVTAGNAPPLTKTSAAQLGKHASVSFVVPEAKKVVDIESPTHAKTLAGMTLLATLPNDPFLAFHNADVLRNAEDGIVLSRAASEKLRIQFQQNTPQRLEAKPGQRVIITVTRNEGTDEGKAQVELDVRGVVDLGEANVAYVYHELLDWIEDYQQGHAVRRLGWPAFAKSATPGYEGYVCFAKAPLSAVDSNKLAASGLIVVPLDASNPEHAMRCSLGGLLKRHQLCVYYLSAGEVAMSGAAPCNLTLSTVEIEEITDADDIVLPWSPPKAAVLNSLEYHLVGVSLQRRWLRSHFHDPNAGYDFKSAPPQVQFCEAFGNPSAAEANFSLSETQNIRMPASRLSIPRKRTLPPGIAAFLRSIPAALADLREMLQPKRSGAAEPSNSSRRSITAGELTTTKPVSPPPLLPIAVVPADFLAHLHAFERGEVWYDDDLSLFRPVPRENAWYQARVYARTLNDVPSVDAFLREQGYTVQSERMRVEEIRSYARTLDLLVWIVGGLVLLFGIWTLVAVLSDNTARKRGSLAVLRAIGVSRWGILLFVLGRAVLIGLIAGGVAIPLSLALTFVINAYLAQCELQAVHLVAVVAIAVICCLAGGLVPAFQASRVDPAVGIKDGDLH